VTGFAVRDISVYTLGVYIEYNVAAVDRFHTRSTVVSVWLLTIKPVTGDGNVLENTAMPLLMKLI
jgi:hypothetical protein